MSLVSRDPILLTPGPLTTSLPTKAAMLRDWGSWDAAFNAITARVRERLVAIGHGEGTHVCVPLQGSGTFSVEAAMNTLVPRDGHVLVLINGAYGSITPLPASRRSSAMPRSASPKRGQPGRHASRRRCRSSRWQSGRARKTPAASYGGTRSRTTNTPHGTRCTSEPLAETGRNPMNTTPMNINPVNAAQAQPGGPRQQDAASQDTPFSQVLSSEIAQSRHSRNARQDADAQAGTDAALPFDRPAETDAETALMVDVAAESVLKPT